MADTRINLLVVSKKTEQALKLRDDLQSNPGYRVHFEETAEAAMKLILGGNMGCVVFNFENFGSDQVKLIGDIKRVSNVFQILVFAESADPESVREVKGAKGIILIEKPLLNLNRDIAGLCERLIGGEEVYQRESKRHATDQRAAVEILPSNRKFEGKLLDVSQNGARVEIIGGSTQAKEKVRLTIDLDQLGRQRTITCEVRWARPTPHGVMVGLRFLKS